ncbi:drug/metabolite transporter (DMT)-like permease [Rhodobium orientis]|uniref:EamA family transporter n=1 Tax=Rhodobium orientis TaxID=34017 RepID=A0A327JUF8_9HYPH|nr:DMT family transporter [Rhodobium orientis]MBB4301032.1 drug/metabolite transporter (DMT)-like permease [Rhodobium orientis]MBK5949700.1 EamA family transporter [Rhodobium orientis]RAI30180.1 EamA family transporter [Rhodobium orientis]
MDGDRTTFLASATVVATGVLWGLYWLPVRRLAELALPGAWGSVAIVAAATLLLAPLAIRGRRHLAAAGVSAIASVALGGVAFVLYSIAFVYGRVAIVILLFFLTPVWSTLIGRYVMGWPTPTLRIAAIVVGLAGLTVMLGAGGDVPIPRGTGEWLALASGMLWSVATTGIRSKARLEPGAASFIFAAGAFAGALALAPLLAPWPGLVGMENPWPTLGWALAAGGIWWGASMAGLMWATPRLEPARVGILLMAEVLIGAVSAAIIAGEHLGPWELTGGALVLCAAVLEVWPVSRKTGAG